MLGQTAPRRREGQDLSFRMVALPRLAWHEWIVSICSWFWRSQLAALCT